MNKLSLCYLLTEANTHLQKQKSEAQQTAALLQSMTSKERETMKRRARQKLYRDSITRSERK